MVAIKMYRGDLHRLPATAARRWPPRPVTIRPKQFKILRKSRSRAVSRSLPPPPPPPLAVTDKDEEGMGDSGSNRIETLTEVTDAETDPVVESTVTEVAEIEPVVESAVTCREVTDSSHTISEKENVRIEKEKKLQALKEKKHQLVQMLKMILHTEEEIKRRSSSCIPTSGFRASIPVQPESASEMGSTTRHSQKLSVDVNFGGDLGGEVDAAASHSFHPHDTNAISTTSPASLIRPKDGSLQQNTVLLNPGAAVLAGHGQPSTPSSTKSMPIASSSPFSSTVNQSHPTFSTPMSVPGTNFAASTPSPASGAVSSVFRDSRSG